MTRTRDAILFFGLPILVLAGIVSALGVSRWVSAAIYFGIAAVIVVGVLARRSVRRD